MKSRRLRNKKHLKSKRLSKKVKVQHKKSKKTMRRRRNVTRKRGGRDIPLKRVPEIDIVAVIKKNTNLVIGWKLNNVPALAIPFLNPSISA